MQTFQVDLVVKILPASAGANRCEFDPWVRKIPWRGKGNILQDSCLEDSTDTGTWSARVHWVTNIQRWLKRLSTHTLYFMQKTFLLQQHYLLPQISQPLRTDSYLWAMNFSSPPTSRSHLLRISQSGTSCTLCEVIQQPDWAYEEDARSMLSCPLASDHFVCHLNKLL